MSDFINIYIPQELKSKMQLYLENKDLNKLIKEVLEKESEIRLIITKDKDIAKQLKSQTIKKFKK